MPDTNCRAAVKICGLREAEHVAAAAEVGATMLGFVFAASARQVTPEAARALIAGLRGARGPAAPCCVGVFVNEAPAAIAAVADACDLDVVQLSGDEAPSVADLLALGRPVIRMFRPEGTPGALAAEIATWQVAARAADCVAGPLRGPWGSRLLAGVDARHGAAYGGTGMRADWSLAACVAAQGPLLLAGGLTPATVPAALAAVRPWGVDVSSGVETAGRKDPALIADFASAVLSFEF